MASGDVILLCDQDDRWLPTKIETMLCALGSDPRTQIVLCDEIICDADLNPSQFTAMTNLMKAHPNPNEYCPGCCMAFRRELLEIVLPIPVDLYDHDHWINAVALTLDVRKLIPDRLQLYRRHSGAASNWVVSEGQRVRPWKMALQSLHYSPVLDWNRACDRLAFMREHVLASANRLRAMGLGDRIEPAVALLERRHRATVMRIALMTEPRATRWAKIVAMLLGGEYRDFNGWKSAAKDLVRRRDPIGRNCS